MSDTPETNKNLWDHGDEIDPSMRPDSNGNWVPEEFARRLERERDKWEETARLYCKNSEHHREMREKAERERDEARELADSYRIAFCSANGMDKAPNPFPWEELK